MKPLRPTYQRNGFCLWLKRLEAERFKTKPDAGAVSYTHLTLPTIYSV